jgi:hypothetical protein
VTTMRVADRPSTRGASTLLSRSVATVDIKTFTLSVFTIGHFSPTSRIPLRRSGRIVGNRLV